MVNWFKKNSQRLAVLVIVISLTVGAVGLFLTQKRLADTQEQLLNITEEQQEAAKSRDQAVENINKETRRIGVVLCAIIRQQDPDLTDEERREIRELCEMEFRPTPNNGNSMSTNDGSNGNDTPENGNDTPGSSNDTPPSNNGNGNNGLNGILQPIRDLMNGLLNG